MSLISRLFFLATTAVSGRKKSIDAALHSKKTIQANFVKPVPVFIVYFSQAALVDGTIVNYKDLYNRDG